MSWLSEFARWLWDWDQAGPFAAATAGAFAGTWGAQIAANRSARRIAVVSELRAINSALGVSFSIANTFINLKQQHIKGIIDRYRALERHHKQVFGNPSEKQPGTFVFLADWQGVSFPAVPLEALQKLAFEQVDLRGRGLQAAVQLIASVQGLRDTLELRRQLADVFRSKIDKPEEVEELVHLYLGLPLANGVDRRMADNIKAMAQQIDDCIFFAMQFSRDVGKHGRSMRNRERWWFWRLPSLDDQIDWSGPQKEGLVPTAEQYQPWMKGFVKRPSFWVRALAKLLRRQMPPNKQLS